MPYKEVPEEFFESDLHQLRKKIGEGVLEVGERIFWFFSSNGDATVSVEIAGLILEIKLKNEERKGEERRGEERSVLDD